MKTMQRVMLTGLLTLATLVSGCVVHEHGHTTIVQPTPTARVAATSCAVAFG